MIGYNYHLEISELLADGWSYEDAVARCEFVFGGDEGKESNEIKEVKRKELSPSEIRSELQRKKWLEKTARKTKGENKDET